MAKAKPQPRESSGTTTIPLSERVWIDLEPSKQDRESYDLSKRVINLLRHNQKLHREQDGAIQFYKTNKIVMWEILLSNADWDCFRILILREILKIQNPLLEEHYVSSVATHLFQ